MKPIVKPSEALLFNQRLLFGVVQTCSVTKLIRDVDTDFNLTLRTKGATKLEAVRAKFPKAKVKTYFSASRYYVRAACILHCDWRPLTAVEQAKYDKRLTNLQKALDSRLASSAKYRANRIKRLEKEAERYGYMLVLKTEGAPVTGSAADE